MGRIGIPFRGVAALGLLAGLLVVAAPNAAAAPSGGGLTAVTPARLLDTRHGIGVPAGAVAAGHTITIVVTGTGGVPSLNVGAVVLNVTVTQPASGGFLTVYPFGGSRPPTSNLNFLANETVPNLAVVAVGTGGKVSFYNGSSGTVQIIADVSGWYGSTTGTPEAGGFSALSTPARLMDTRKGTGASGPVLAGHTVSLAVTGHGGVPSLNVGAVVLNVTVTQPSASGFLTVYPNSGARPTTSNLNFSAHETVPNLVVVAVGGGGEVNFYNGSPGTVQMIADVSGWFETGGPGVGGFKGLTTPARLMDTRKATGASGPVRAGHSVSLPILGHGTVPPHGVGAVVLNVTVTQPTGPGFLTVSPDGVLRPGTSNLNFSASETVPNLVIVAVGPDGKVDFYNGSAGTVQILADVSGWFATPPTPIPLNWNSVAASEPIPEQFSAASCPSSGFCAAVSSSSGDAVVFTSGSWQTISHADASGSLNAVSCVSSTLCDALDQLAGKLFVYNGTSWTADSTPPATLTTFPFAALSCVAGTSFCMLVDSGGNMYTSTDGATWTSHTALGSSNIIGLSCVSSTSCLALDTTEKVQAWNGTTWTAGGSIPNTDFISSDFSCESASVCTIDGFDPSLNGGQGAQVIFVYSGASWSEANNNLPSGSSPGGTSNCTVGLGCFAVDISITGAELDELSGGTWSAVSNGGVNLKTTFQGGFACASTTFCALTSANQGQTFNGTTWTDVQLGWGNQVQAVSCATSTFCMAVDDGSNATSYNGTIWTKAGTAVANANYSGPQSLSCPTATFCAAVDTSTGNVDVYNSGVWSSPAADLGVFSTAGFEPGISCTSSSFCAAASGDQVATYNGTTWTAASTLPSTDVNLDPSPLLDSVSCTSSSFCMAADQSGFVSLYNGSTWSALQQVDTDAAVGGGFGGFGNVVASCLQGPVCAVTGFDGAAEIYSGGTWSAPNLLNPGSSLSNPSCGTSYCTVSDGFNSYFLEQVGGIWTWSSPEGILPSFSGNFNGVVNVLGCAATSCVAIALDNETFGTTPAVGPIAPSSYKSQRSETLRVHHERLAGGRIAEIPTLQAGRVGVAAAP